jgi:PAS domain S-box-containing protein
METSFQKKEDIYHLFMQAPVGIYLLKGPDYVIEMANDPILQLWGKGDKVIGKPVLECFPEVAEQGFIQLLDDVRATGISFQTDEIAVWYDYNGVRKQKYVTLLYQPYYEAGEITGIFSIATDVTEKVLAQRRLEENAQNLRNVIRQAPMAMCLFMGPQHVVEMVNERMLDLWGKSRADVQGKPIFEALPEAGNQGLEELLERVFANGETIEADERPVMLPRGGGAKTVYVNFVYEPLKEGGGEIAGIMAIAVDVTEQVEARKKIEASEQRFRALVTATSNVVYRMSADWSEMRELEGTGVLSSLGEPVGDWLEQYIHPDDKERVKKAIQKAIRTKGVFEMEHRMTLEDGTEGWTFSRAIPILDEEGKILEWFGAATDITSRKRAEQAYEQAIEDAEKQRRLLEAFSGSTPDLVYIFDLDYHFTYANAALLAMWGKTWKQAEGRGLLELGYEPWHAEMHEREIDQVVATRQPIRGEVSFPHATLGKRIYDYIFAPVINQNGDVEAVAGTTRDITELKLAEQAIRESERHLQEKVAERTSELERTVEELKRLNGNLEEFAYAASHDLKEPVRKVHFFADRLKDRLAGKMEADDLRLFERMAASTNRMATLIDELLMYSQVTRGVAQMEEVNLNRKLQLVQEDLELEIQEKKAEINVSALPTVTGNKRQLQQLFFNLVGNALKYSRQNVPPHIDISSRTVKGRDVVRQAPNAQSNREYHLIEVADNGLGFAQEDAERIFQVFTRLHGVSEYRGSGIGLSIVRKVAENHKGWVWAESTPGLGSKFYVLLPANTTGKEAV